MSKSIKLAQTLTPIALAIALSACGGGSSGADFGSNSNSNTTTTVTEEVEDTVDDGVDNSSVQDNAAYLEVQASSKQLFSSGSSPVILSAVVKDVDNNVINDANVSFSVDNRATLDNDINEGSIVTKKLTTGFGDDSKENRTLTIVAKSGDLTETLEVDVVGTTLSLQGPENTAVNEPVDFFVKLADSDGNGLDRQLVSVVSEKGYPITSESGLETDSNGDLVLSYTALGFGSDKLTVEALGASSSQDIDVSSQNFVMDASSDEIMVNTDGTISINWKVNDVPQAGKKVFVRATRGLTDVTEVITDSNGVATFTISSETAGKTVISAETEDGLITKIEKEFVAITPHYLSSVVSPSVISLFEKSTVITTVRDIDDNPVKNQRVIYVLKDTVGGEINNSVATTDSYGRAEINYTAGPTSSGLEGVVIDTYLESNTALTQTVTLTVGGDAHRLVVGMDNDVEEVDNVFYKATVGVIVTDSAGGPLANQEVDFSLVPTHYIKGFIEPRYEDTYDVDSGLTFLSFTGWTYSSSSVVCPSEDLDNDSQKDDGEDINNNGILDPTNTATITGEGITDSQGKVTVDVIYPKSQAWWTTLQLKATAKVAGSEFVETSSVRLPVAETEVNDLIDQPVNQFSPFGLASDCMNPD